MHIVWGGLMGDDEDAVARNNPKCATFTIDTRDSPGFLDNFGPSRGQGEKLGHWFGTWYLVLHIPGRRLKHFDRGHRTWLLARHLVLW